MARNIRKLSIQVPICQSHPVHSSAWLTQRKARLGGEQVRSAKIREGLPKMHLAELGKASLVGLPAHQLFSNIKRDV